MNAALLSNLSEAELFRVARESDDPLVCALLTAGITETREQELEGEIQQLEAEAVWLAAEVADLEVDQIGLHNLVSDLCDALHEHDKDHELFNHPMVKAAGWEAS